MMLWALTMGLTVAPSRQRKKRLIVTEGPACPPCCRAELLDKVDPAARPEGSAGFAAPLPTRTSRFRPDQRAYLRDRPGGG